MLERRMRDELQAITGATRLCEDEQTLALYSCDVAPGVQSLADGVVFPGSTREVAEIVRVCARHRTPVTPRGGGSNVCGGAAPTQGGLVIVMMQMNRLLEIDRENLTATVQPGLDAGEFQRRVEETGLFYPPCPSGMAVRTMGGNVALGAGGLHGLKYGTTKDYVLGLEAVLANGEIVRTGGKLVKDVAGYDLTRLLVGSEGTLAIITEITLKLFPQVAHRRAMIAVYARLDAAARTVSGIFAERIIPCTLEFMDQSTVRAVERFAPIGLPIDAEAVLVIEQDGNAERVGADLARIGEICRREGAADIRVARTPEEGANVMDARRNALSALACARPTTILGNATVPRSRIGDMVVEIRRIAAKYDVQISTFGHAGDGNLHPTAMTDADNPEEMLRVEQAFAEIFTAAVNLGGAMPGDNGVGAVKAPHLQGQMGEAGVVVMRGIKQAFDPDNTFNPGRVFAPQTRRRVVIQR